MLIYGENERCRAYLKERIAQVPCWDERAQTIGLVMNGSLSAAAIFENFNTHDIEVSLAIDGRATPAFLLAAFSYPFLQLACRRLTTMVPPTATRTLDLVRRLGFVEEGRRRDATPDGDLLMFGMLRSECKYL